MQNIIKQCIELGVNNENLAEVEKIIESIANDKNKIEILENVLQSEIDKTYLEPTHFENTLKQKQYFDIEFTLKVSQIFTLLYPYESSNQASNYFQKINNEETLTDASLSLKENGYWVCPQLLDDDIIDSLVTALGSADFYTRNKLGTVKGYHHEKAQKIKSNTAWIKDGQSLLNVPSIQELTIDSFLLDIIGNYLNVEPIHVQCNCWWSLNYNNSKQSMKANAQLFHQDKEFIKFLKIFVYLNDVDESNGAHIYVKGSHRENRFAGKEDYKFSQRLIDKEIFDAYGEENIITMKGKKGTVILEDTSGFHKGMPIENGHRLLLQIEYANSLYFNPVHAFQKINLSTGYKAFLDDHPRFALNYSDDKYSSDMKKIKKQRFKKNIKGFLKEKVATVLNK